MARTSSHLAASALCLSLSTLTLATACTGSGASGGGRAQGGEPTPMIGADAAATDTAELRAGLTFLLTEHVFDVADTAKALLNAKGNPADRAVFEATEALDANSVALAAVVTGYAKRSHDDFLADWRLRTTLLLQYAAAVNAGVEGEALRIRVALDQSCLALAREVHSFVPPLPAQTVQRDLQLQTSPLTAALDTFAAHRPGGPAELARAAALMLPVAGLLSTGIAAENSLQ